MLHPFPMQLNTPPAENDVVHVVCCMDQNMALCGEDVSDLPWDPDPVDCTQCDHNDHWNICPIFTDCIEPDMY